jgi:hypothetical protein
VLALEPEVAGGDVEGPGGRRRRRRMAGGMSRARDVVVGVEAAEISGHALDAVEEDDGGDVGAEAGDLLALEEAALELVDDGSAEGQTSFFDCCLELDGDEGGGLVTCGRFAVVFGGDGFGVRGGRFRWVVVYAEAGVVA